jgi:sensor histidine kinase YesM
MIPIFRRWPWSRSRDLIFTFIWSCGIGLVFMAIAAAMSGQWPSWRGAQIYLLVSNLIGYSIHVLFLIGDKSGIEAYAIQAGYVTKAIYFAATPVVGVIMGFGIYLTVFEPIPLKRVLGSGWVASVMSTSVVISIMISILFYLRERDATAQAELERERLRAERVEREAALANLRALQAQIEPHFLFNTLANVASLVDTDPARAKHMLESFNRFLRASLSATRGDSTTLGEEAELISAYLDVLVVRMGDRLHYAIDVPPNLAGQRLAPMLLQPVVENAIRHGLEPKVEGGELKLAARREKDDIVVEVRDTGVGFGATTCGGVGLTNLRERLSGLYGERASLAIGDNAPAGTVVTVRLPA